MRGQFLNPASLTTLFRKEFELCAVKPGETVILLSDPGTRRDYPLAAFAAATDLGADSYEICVSQKPDIFRVSHAQPGQGKGLMAALKAADLVCTFFSPNLSLWMKELRAAGTRLVMAAEAPDQLARLLSPPGLKEAVTHAVRRWTAAREIHVTSAAGTDLRWRRGEDSARGYYGFAELPGRFDQWGGGHIAEFPDEGTANGKVVVMPGDIWILPYVRMVESPITLEVRDGFIRKVEGGADAMAFRGWLDRNKRSADDLDPYAVSHLGFGLHPNAQWDNILVYGNSIDDLQLTARSFAGNFLFSTGPSNKRTTGGHIDMPMCGCTVTLDNEVVLDRGRLVDPAMIVPPHYVSI